jgi:hypothetical protein
MKKFLIWFAANVLSIIGAFLIGYGIPPPAFPYMIVIGIACFGTSVYFKFIRNEL